MNEQRTTDTLVLVHDTECEKAVLGTLLLDNSLYHRAAEIVDEECFYDPKCLDVWKAIESIKKDGMEIDTVTMSTYFIQRSKPQMLPFFVELTNYASMVNVYRHCQRLNDLRIRRKAWVLSEALRKGSTEETTDIVEFLSDIKAQFESVMSRRVNSTFTMQETFAEITKIIEENQKNEGFTGSPTGFERLDRLGGLHPGWLITLAGATAQGKTSFADCIVKSCIDYGHKVAFYSMEMTREELVARFLSMKSGIGAGDILYSNRLTSDELAKIDKAQLEYPGENLIFDDKSTSNIDNIVASIFTMHARYEIKGAVVDYIQMLNVNMNATNKEALMGECARKLKNIAKELKIWIIVLSQFNRDQNNPVPTLDRLRDSGQIAEASDVCLLLYRAEYYHRSFPVPFDNVDPKGKAMVDIAKGRNIEIGRFLTNWDGKTTTFSDIRDNYDSVLFVNETIPAPTTNEIAPF